MAKRKRDQGDEETEALLNRLEKRIQAEYTQAATEVEAKYKDYMRRFEAKDRIKRQAAEAGIISEADYQAWRQHQILMGERWQAMLDDLATDIVHTNEIAVSTARGYQEEAYAINHGYATYVIESESGIDTSYTLYDRQTVERLIREDPKLLPDPRPGGETAKKLAENKDLRWNRQKLSSAIMQGVIQGESVPQMAKRLESVVDMDHKAAIRNARTMVTGAQNAGRMDAARRAQSMGIGLTNVWMATLDMRTRHEHRLLDGQRREVDEPFEVPDTKDKIRYPGDPEAKPHLVYNCRCTLIPQVKGFEYDIRGDAATDFTGIEGMTYDEWKEDRTEKPNRITLPEEKAAAIRGSYNREYEALREKTLAIFGESDTIEPTGAKPHRRKEESPPQDSEPQPPKSLEHFQEYEAEWRATHYGDLTAEERELIRQKFQEMFDRGEYHMRIEPGTLSKVLDSGRFMNQHEVAASNGVYDPALRRKAARQLFGADVEHMTPRDFEKYGYLGYSDFGIDASSPYIGNYGSVTVRFKKQGLRNRVTYTHADSLVGAGSGTQIAGHDSDHVSISGIDDYNIQEVLSFLSGPKADMIYDPNKVAQATNAEYFELQYHGDLLVSDIESVCFTGVVREDLVERLKALGIRVFKVEWGAVIEI